MESLSNLLKTFLKNSFDALLWGMCHVRMVKIFTYDGDCHLCTVYELDCTRKYS